MSMFGQPEVNTQLKIKNFILVQSGSYQEQHLRPFAVTANQQTVDALTDVTDSGRNLGVGAVQEIAASVIRPQTNSEGATGIDQGWRSRRFRFLMKVEESHGFMGGTTTQRIFFGYTDHCDASTNYLDPEMRIYFNSETIVNQYIEQTPAGPVWRSNISAANQIIAPVGHNAPSQDSYMSDPLFLIRPEDVFSLSQTQVVADNLMSSGALDGPITSSIDHRAITAHGNSYQYSKRRDTSPTRYLSNTLNCYQNAVMEANTDQLGGSSGGNQESILSEAVSFSRNARLRTNTFLSVLRDNADYMQRGYVTLRELQNLFPETTHDSVLRYSMDNGQSLRKVSYAEDSRGWGGADHTTIGASLVSQTVPSIMMDNFFRSIGFSVTNGVGFGQYAFELNPNMSKSLIDNVSMRSYIQEFERRLGIDILNSLSRSNEIPFKMIVSSDLSGETIIDISLGNAPMERFIAPTFGDSLFSPVVTNNMLATKNVASDMFWLVSEVVNPSMNVTNSAYSSGSTTSSYNHPTATVVTSQQHNIGVNYDNAIDLGLV